VSKVWGANFTLATQMFGPAEIFFGPVRTQFGLVGLATFSFWASQIKEIGVSKLSKTWKRHFNDTPLKHGPAEIFFGPVRTQFGLVGLATFSFSASHVKEIGVSKDP